MTHLWYSTSSLPFSSSSSSTFNFKVASACLATLDDSENATWLARIALRRRELKYKAEDCICERVSELRCADEDGARTASAAETSVSQRSTSFWRVDTSSTEHFFEATRATFDSSTRPSRARPSPGSGKAGADALRRRSLVKSSSMSGGRGLLGLLLGVLQPLLGPLKSMRMRRTVPRVNCSRQNGQAGDKRDVVFSSMLSQQLKHNTCPGWGKGG